MAGFMSESSLQKTELWALGIADRNRANARSDICFPQKIQHISAICGCSLSPGIQAAWKQALIKAKAKRRRKRRVDA